MKITILGAGGIGLGMAVLLSETAAEVRIWAPTATGIQPLLDGAPLVGDGVLAGQYEIAAHLDLARAVKDADIVVIAVPGTGHKAVIDRLVPHLRQPQMVAISSHMSLSALYLARKLERRGLDVPISAWATTAVTGRRTAPGQVHVSTVRRHVVASTVRTAHYDAASRRLRTVFGDIFSQASGLLAATLMNVNPATHLAVCLCNLTRMEYGEKWGAYHGISPAVGRLIEALDGERLALAATLGLHVHSVQSHLHDSFGLALAPVADMAAEQHVRRGGTAFGPTRLDHRFVVEDVPFGIVPLVAFGRIAGVPMPRHEAGLTLIGALYGRDFIAENDVLPTLDLEGLDRERLLALCGEPGPRASALSADKVVPARTLS